MKLSKQLFTPLTREPILTSITMKTVALITVLGFSANLAFAQDIVGLQLKPATLVGGGLVKATIKLDTPAGSEGYPVTLRSDALTAKTIGLVTVPAGSSEITVDVPTYKVSDAQTVQLTATSGAQTRSSNLQLTKLNLSDYYVYCRYNGEYARLNLGTGTWLQLTNGYPAYTNYTGATISPVDGSLVADFVSPLYPSYQLFRIEGDGSFGRTQLTFSGQNFGARFSPDGKSILYIHSDLGTEWTFPGTKTVRLWDVASGTSTALVSDLSEDPIWCSWSPDGTAFFYGTDPGSHGGRSTIKRKTFSGDVTEIGTCNWPGPLSISPNQEKLCMLSNDFGNYSVNEMTIADGSLRFLVPYSYAGHSYFPDGTFLYSGEGTNSIYHFDPDTGGSYPFITTAPGLWSGIDYAIVVPKPLLIPITGKLFFQDFVGLRPTQATFEFLEPGSDTVVRQSTASIAANGAFTANAPSKDKFDMRVKVTHWLGAKRAVDVTSGAVGNIVISLLNGDIDGDNSVTIVDYSVLSDYFDTSNVNSDWGTVGSNGFAPRDADLDGDGAVTIVDYSILSDNFDKTGA